MHPQSLLELEQELRKLLDPTHHARPFICDGSPFGCDVVIVGINPATVTPFWPFWNPSSGFDKPGWLLAYKADPLNKRNQTRPRVEALVRGLLPLRSLELNIFPYSSPNERELPVELRDKRVFNLMLSLSRPKLLFIFGNTPILELASTLHVAPFAKEQFTACEYQGHKFDVFATSHLSRGWSMERVADLAKLLKKKISGEG